MNIRVIAAALIAAAPLAATAANNCPEIPRDQWLKAEEVQSRLQSRGYDVRSVKRRARASR